MATKSKKQNRFFKRLDSSGHYRYYDRKTKKRISPKIYFKKIRVTSKRVPAKKRIIKKRITKKRQSRIKKTLIKGKIRNWLEFTKKVKLLLSETKPEAIYKKYDDFFKEVRARFKTLKGKMYFSFWGEAIFDDGDTEEKEGYSQRSYLKEYIFNKFRDAQIRALIGWMFEIIGEDHPAFPTLNQLTEQNRREVVDFQLLEIGIRKIID